MENPPEKEQPQIVKVSRPFLTVAQIDLLKGQVGMAGSTGAARRIESFFFVWAVCRQLRLSVRTFTTAVLFIQRLMLMNTVRDVSLAILAGSCIVCAFKIEDTPKKSCDIAAACLKVSAATAGTNNSRPSVAAIEELTNRILALEKHVLETVCFDFRVEHPHIYVVKISHTLDVPQKVAALAWSMATDIYATEAVLRQPAHTIALACVVVASKALEHKLSPIDSKTFGSDRSDVNDTIFELLNHYITPASPLPRPPIAARALDTAKLVPFRDLLAKEIHTSTSSTESGFEGIALRESTLSDKGTARFVLDWEKEHLKGETLA